MPATDTRQEFAPPHTPGLLRALVLALLAHGALVAVLSVGVAWKRELPPVTMQAELWSSVPQEAAPAPPEDTLPEPDPATAPEAPAPPVVKPAEPDVPRQADIALAKEKARLLEAQKAKELQAKQALERQLAEKRQQEQAAKEKQEKDKLAKDKADKAQKAAADKQKADKAAKAQAQRAEQERQQQLARLAGLAGGTGSGTPSSTGTASHSAGPGANYSGRIQAAVKPNITFTETIVGNPKTEIEVTLAANGEILSKRITKRSGNRAWDEAAENAIDKTRKLPLDDGKVWSPMLITISPQTLVGP